MALSHKTDISSLQALIYNAHLEVIHDTINTSGLATVQNGASPSADEDLSAIEYTRLGEPVRGEKRVLPRADEAAFKRRLQRIMSGQTVNASISAYRKTELTTQKHEITEEHLHRVLESMRPSVPPEERLRLDQIYRSFVSDRSGELPVPPEAGGIGQRVSLM